jgi:uncharacterized protein YecT (DUF1311 family)
MKLLHLVFLSLLSANTFAGDDNLQLRSFSNPTLFDQAIIAKQQVCLDESGGGSKAVACFTTYYQEWDEELNYYYGRLRSILNADEKEKLKTAQLAWIKSRDEARVLNSAVMDKLYADKEGTMYVAIRSGHVSELMTPITKQRALLLKQWYDDIQNPE